MAILKPAHKVFVVTRLAMFDTPRLVASAFKEQFPGEPPPTTQQLASYDPTLVSGVHLSKELRKLFADTRKQFLKAWKDIPIANKSVRLRLLNDSAYKALEKGNVVLGSSLIEQAAKEAGEAFTNRHHLNVAGKIDTGTTDTQLANTLTRLGVKVRMRAPVAGQEQGGGDAGG